VRQSVRRLAVVESPAGDEEKVIVNIRRTLHLLLLLQCWCLRTERDQASQTVGHFLSSGADKAYCLIIFAPRPRHNIRRARLGPTAHRNDIASALLFHTDAPQTQNQDLLFGLFRRSRLGIDELFPEAHQSTHHPAYIPLQVANAGRHEPLTGFCKKVWFLNFPFC
jgi:hypothetical protein